MPTTVVSSPALRLSVKAQEVAGTILRTFQQPDELPAALAPIFIHRRDNVPCRSWSWANQLIVALHGYSDARGYRQWQQVHRQVRKAEAAFFIFAPLNRTVPDEETEDGRIVNFGFRAVPVFGEEQTEGQVLPAPRPYRQWFASLPLRDVAAHWNITVTTRDGSAGAPLGSYSSGRITLRVTNLATWCHELVHAADDRNGGLTELGQHWRSETVAELGAAILLKTLGHETDADLGGCWDYIRSYAGRAGVHPFLACQRVLKRTCDAVSLILDTAECITGQGPPMRNALPALHA